MAERPYAQNHGHAFLAAHVEETAQVAVAVPVPPSLLWFVVNPETVGGNDGDAASLHFLYFPSPFPFGHPGIVYLSHHGQCVPSVDDDTF